MEHVFNHPWELGLSLAIALAAAIEAGRRTAIYSAIHQDASRKDQLVAIRDGLFFLVSLLLGFTMSMAVSRYDLRRLLLVDEVNAIGTTYLRAGTLVQPYRDHGQQLLRQYVDARIDLDGAGLDHSRFTEASNRSKRIQEQLWSDVVALTQVDRSAITATYINTMNEMIDLHEKRVAALENRIPRTIWLLILLVSLIAFFTRGMTITRRFWLNLILAPTTIAIVVALVADLDAPTSGLIRLDLRSMQRLKADIGRPQ